MTEIHPFATLEVRWFLQGAVEQHPALQRWFETAVPFASGAAVDPPVWQGRSDGRPDIYLVVPGSNDMGIKWREDTLQIKGCVASLGAHLFCGRHQGTIERWIKWSYAGVPSSYRQLFLNGAENGLTTVAVHKTRAQRLVRLDVESGELEEVSANTPVRRGVAVELTTLEAFGNAYCSLAFEAFPCDVAMDAQFVQVVEAFLDAQKGISLTAAQSASYPSWLNRIIEA